MSGMSGGTEVSFASLGKKLMLAREARGLSIEQIAKSTRIRPHLLRHLEGDDFTHFSHPSYLRLYLMDYARFLNVPFQDIRDWLPDAGRPGSENYEYIGGLGSEDVGKPRPEYFYPRGNRHKFWPRLVRGVLVLAVLGLLAALASLIRDLNRIGANGEVPFPAAAADEAPVESAASDAQFIPPVLESTQAPAEVVGVPEDSFGSVVPAVEPPAQSLGDQQANLSLTSPAAPPADGQLQ